MTKFPYEELDCASASVLSVASFLGIVTNFVSLCYFLSMKPRNSNNEFFRRLYSIISLNDILLCISVIPVIEAAFSEDRKGKLFNNRDFCSIWFVLQFVTFHMSMVLLTILSLSRLLLIRNPRVRFNPCCAYIMPGTFLAGYTTLFIGYKTSKLVDVIYIAEMMQCKCMGTFVATNSSTLLYSQEDRTVAGVLLAAECGMSSLGYLTVCISVVASLLYLAKSKKAEVKSFHQPRAAVTVILMTLLFIVFNTLAVMVNLYFMLDWAVLNPVEMGTTTVGEVLIRFSSNVFKDSRILSQYAIFFTTTFGACLNSAMNPGIYYFRLQAYQKFVHQLINSIQARLGQLYRYISRQNTVAAVVR